MASGDLKDKISKCKVLVIGAGGIGCELLKNLALTGFKDITVIDLDTIDISNLNRQFLFRREHVGKSKAEVASEAIIQMVPDINVKYYHDSVMSENFGIDFFKQFTLVMNALDNKAARSHVNRLCLVAEVPLIESGSSGYLGQVLIILKRKTECFDCAPKPSQKTYPACTIRNTPTELIHCVIWAKSLFNQLFGEEDPDDDVSPDISDKDIGDAKENGNANNIANADSVNGNEVMDSDERPKISTRQFADQHHYDSKHMFNKLFNDDINYLLSMENLWKERKSPVPKKFEQIMEEVGQAGSRKLTPNDVWSLYKWTEVFDITIKDLYSKFKEARSSNKVLIWDKDDDTIMKFVAACANIRAEIFCIRGKSLFDIKAMAGNIIPAIATTNACVAGMILVEALKIVNGDFDKCRRVFINRLPTPRGKILVEEKPYAPNPKCYVCSDKREVIVRINLEKMDVGKLRDKVLIGAMHMVEPDVMDPFSNRILISSEEGETDAIMGNKLKSLGVQNGTQLECDDFKQQLNFKLVLMHSEDLNEEEFLIVNNQETNSNSSENGDSTTNKFNTVKDSINVQSSLGEDGPSSAKRMKPE